MPIQHGPRKAGFSALEVQAFMAQFPCSGLRVRPYWFEFDYAGDLVDTDVPAHDDGPGASALAKDARNWLRGIRPYWLP